MPAAPARMLLAILASLLLLISPKAHSQWVASPIDPAAGWAFALDMVADENGTLHAAYFTAGSLKHAMNSGSGWNVQTINSTPWMGQELSIAVTPQRRPVVSYHDSSSKSLMMASRDGNGIWSVEPVHRSSGDDAYGTYSSIAVADDGTIYIAYLNTTISRLYCAHKAPGGNWGTDPLAMAGNLNLYFSLALFTDPSDMQQYPWIFYNDTTNGDLSVIKKNDLGLWNIEIIDDGPAGTQRGASCDAQADAQGALRVSYFDHGALELNVATGDGITPWIFEVVDSGYLANFGTSLDYPRLAYHDEDASRFKVANDTADGWVIEEATSVDDNAMDPRVANLSNGRPVMAYFSSAAGQLLEARPTDLIEPVVTVLSPLSGELWKPGEIRTIRWTVQDDSPIANIEVNYLFNGENLRDITSGLGSVDSLEWLVPDTISRDCYIEIIATDTAGNEGIGYNWDPFTIAYYTPLYHAAVMDPYYLGGHNLRYLDIRQEFLNGDDGYLPATLAPQLASDPDTRRVFVLDDLDGPGTSLTTIDLRGVGSVQTVTPYTPAGFMGLAWDPFTEMLYTMLRPEGSFWASIASTLDPLTGEVQTLGTVSFSPPSSFGLDMIAIAPNGEVYGVSDRQGSPSLWRVDREILQATLVGPLDAGDMPNDIAFVGDELWVQRGWLGSMDLLSTIDGSTLESYYNDQSQGVAQAPCGGPPLGLVAADAPTDGGEKLLLDWSAYAMPPGATQLQIFIDVDPCRIDAPESIPALTVPATTTSAIIPVDSDYLAYFVGIRVLGTAKQGVLNSLYDGPVWSQPNLLINEFAPAGGVPKRGPAKRVGEKVEIRNLSPDPLDITGFRLSNGAGPPSPDEETLSGTVAGGGLFVHILQTIDLPDAGGTIQLLPPVGSPVALDIVSYGNQGGAPTVPAGFTVSRVEGSSSTDPDASSFEASSESFGQTNNVPEPDLGGSVVLNEVVYTSSVGEDYIEIHNPQSTLVNLGQIAISDGIGFLETLSEGLVLPPGARKVLRQSDPGSVLPDLTSPMLYLYKITSDGQYQRVDQLGWDGGPAPGAAPDDALMRIPDGTALYLGDASANWLDCGGDTGLFYGPRSPGEPNQPAGSIVEHVDPAGAPGSHLTIADAIAAAPAPSVILLAPGTYEEFVTLEGGHQLIGAGEDPRDVVLTGGSELRVVNVFLGSVSEASVISNLTIHANNVGNYGTGISVQPGASAIIRNVVFAENHATIAGGGINTRGVYTEVVGCVFEGNSTDGIGGALRVNSSSGSALIRDSLFLFNQSLDRGAAISVVSGNVTVEHCVFDRNDAHDPKGGVVHAAGGTLDVSHSIISNNLSGWHLSTRGAVATTSISFNCGVLDGGVLNLETLPGEGVIDTSQVYLGDPVFCQQLALNYALHESSPLLYAMESCDELIGLSGPPCALMTDAPALPNPIQETRMRAPVPNPFNPRTVIQLDLAREARVDVFVYDARGRRVAALLEGVRLQAGTHPLEWQGRDSHGQAVSSGVYFLRLLLDGHPAGEAQRAVLIR